MYKLKSILLLCLLAFHLPEGLAQGIDPEQVYELHTLSGLAIDNQESVDAGSKIFIAKRVLGKESQVWQFLPVRDNIYCIVSPLSQP